MNTEMFHGDFELLNNCFKIKYNSLNPSKGEDFSKLTPPPKKKKFLTVKSECWNERATSLISRSRYQPYIS